MKGTKLAALALALLMLASCLSACADAAPTQTETSAASEQSDTSAPVEETTEKATDDVPALDFEDDTFRIFTVENPNFRSVSVSHEMDSTTLNDAMYTRTLAIEERFNVNLEETLVADGDVPSKMSTSVLAGDNAFHIFTMRCDHALPFWQKGNIITWDKIDYVDLDKPYWDQKINKSLTLGGVQSMVVNSYNLSTYDLCYVLLFNKNMAEEFNMGDIYSLVRDGSWTFDKMDELMSKVNFDLNGDGKLNAKDRWGFLCNTKMVTPDFWIAAGETSVKKDADDMPYLAMGEDRFLRVWEKIYTIMYDHNNWFAAGGSGADVPDTSIKLFSAGQALFMDASLFSIESLREMDADFGIIPYPKFDTEQKDYYARVSYYCPTLIPQTNPQLEMTGALMEALACESYNTVIPAYYDVLLVNRYSRDVQSQEMLDLIFDSFVIDIGDTTLCASIRDAFVATMMANNDRSFASTVEKNMKPITKQLEKLVEKISQ